MSDTIIVDVVAVEANALTVDVVTPAPVALVVDVIAPAPAVVVVEVGAWGSVPVGYPQLPVELQQLPVTFPFGGKPIAGTVVNVPLGFSLIVPPGLVGTVSYAAVAPTADAVFMLNRLDASGALTNLGSIVLTASGDDILVGNGGTLAVGEVLQLATPATQDPTLSDVGITVITERVQ
jgi:hypothetical protein